LSVTPDTVEDMAIDVRFRRPEVAVRYLGALVIAAVVALSASGWHIGYARSAEAAVGAPVPGVPAPAPVAPGWSAAPEAGALDTEDRDSRPAVVHHSLRDRARALVTAGAAPAASLPTWWMVAVALVGCVVLRTRQGTLRPRPVVVGPGPRGPPPRA
jgi:hypothetical protein